MINKNYVDINKKIPRITAIQSLVGGEISYRDDGKGNIKIDYLNRDEDFTPPTDDEIDAELKKLQDNYDGQGYARTRAQAYPEIGDQLDALYHAGVFPDDMAAKIKKVKDDNPKST